MSTIILGVNSTYHESSACLLKDGEIIGAVEEERFNRVKHAKHSKVDNAHELPTQAIACVLRMAQVTAADVDHVGYTIDPEMRRAKNRDLHEKGIPAGDYGTPEGEETFYRSNMRAIGLLREQFPRAEVHALKHHLCHAASAFYPSKHERAAVLAIDGIGEFATTFLGVGNGNQLELLSELEYPSSLGFVWERMSEHLGFDVYSGPGKVMGYACITDPIGETSAIDYADRMRRVVRLEDKGFSVDNRVMRFRTTDFEGLTPLFGPRRTTIVDRFEEASIASGLQVVTEEIFVRLARILHGATKADALCVAGGVGLNCVANARILEETPFRYLHVEPAANDAGTALGAACLIWCQILGNKKRPRLDHTYLGPEYTEAEMAGAIGAAGLKPTKPDDLAQV